MTSVQLKVPNWLDKLFTWPVLLYRKRKYGYTFRRIYLGKGEYTIVEPADYYWLNSYRWIVFGNGNSLYAVRTKMIGSNKTCIESMHRLIMNHPKNLMVDHRDGRSLDNRRSNLRNATRRQNILNRRKISRKTSSQYIGVHLHKPGGKWMAAIRKKGKQTYLGLFVNEIDAAKAYDAAARKYHGEFARLNFPEA